MKSLSLALSLIFLVACGSSDSPENDNPPDLNSTINESNAEKIISDAFSSFDDINDFDDLFLEQPVQKVNQKLSVSSNALAIVYCGEDPETDTGNGFMDVTISGNFITTLNILVQFSLCTFEQAVVVDGDYELDFSEMAISDRK